MGKIINIPGKFYPKGDLTALVCNHRFGKNCSWSEGSDNYLSDAHYPAEASAFKYNVPLHNNVNTLIADQIADVIQSTGRMPHDFYFPTDYWKNPNTGVIEVMPDYYATEWTSAGEGFFNVTAGQTKVIRYPNHGQDLYDLSSGALGYDFTTDTEGTNALVELYGMLDVIIPAFESFVGRKPSTFCFRNGKEGAAWLLKNYFLSGRTSGYTASGNSYTHYGKDWVDKVTDLGYTDGKQWTGEVIQQRECSTRWRSKGYADGDNDTAYQESTAYNLAQLAATVANGGWFHDFVHWVYIYPNLGDQRQLYYDDYLSQMVAYANANDVYMGGYGEIAEYFALRDQVQKVVVSRTSNGFHFAIDRELNNEFQSVSDDLLNTPISVYIDLSTTEWSGTELIPSNGVVSILKLATDEFVIQINKGGGDVIDDATGDYLDESLPVITPTYADGILTINTDVATKVVVWENTLNTNFYEIDVEHLRDNTLATTRGLALTTGRNIFIGAIGINGQSSLTLIVI